MLKPQEYYYLYSPMRSDPVEMIRYTFQSLCLQGALSLHVEYVYVNKRDKVKRKRYFFRRNDHINAIGFSNSEKLMLGLFNETRDLRVYQLSNKLKTIFNKEPGVFKGYVHEDVSKRGFMFSGFFLSRKGRQAKKECAHLIDSFERDIDQLLSKEEKLLSAIIELGSNLIFLDSETISKLKIFTKEHLLNPENPSDDKVPRLETIAVLKKINIADFTIPNQRNKRSDFMMQSVMR